MKSDFSPLMTDSNRTLAQRRSEMLEFMVENTLGTTHLEIGNRELGNYRLLVEGEQQPFFIQLLSRPMDFFDLLRFRYFSPSREIDTNRDNLLRLYQKWCQYVVDINEADLIPGTVLLQSETNFSESQLDEKSVPLINKIGFLHQVTSNKWQTEVIYNRRVLGLTDRVLHELFLHPENPLSQSQTGTFRRELSMFNINKGFLEVNALREPAEKEELTFYDTLQGSRKDYCVVCEEVEKLYNHKECKDTRTYQKHASHIAKIRYQRDNYIFKQRSENIEFETFALDKEHLKLMLPRRKLARDNYYIASVK